MAEGERFSAMLAEKFASFSFKSARRSWTGLQAESENGQKEGDAADPSPDGDNLDTGLGRDGVAVSVVVRCRPACSPSEPMFNLVSEQSGRDKVSVKISVTDDDWDKLGGVEESRKLRFKEARSFRCNAYLGPQSSQEDIFEQVSPIVERTIEGYNGTIFCYGVTGSGKTYTMSGPVEEVAQLRDASSPNTGIVPRVSRKIFEYIRDRSAQGEVYIVEASFLEIYSPDGTREQLIDLLASDERKLEVRQDPLNLQSFVCDNLKKVPIRTPDELCEVLSQGQQRCTFMETTRNCHSSRSHCMLMLTIESLATQPGMNEPIVQRGKLMLVDLAGSESLKRIQAASDGDEDLRRKQAIGINRVLSSLSTVVNNINIGLAHGHRDSALTMLLRDCLGGNARALLIANVGPELDNIDETAKTLTFSQQMMTVRNVANVNRIDQDQSSLLQMKQRHSECIRMLQEKVTDTRQEEQDDRRKLQQEMEDLNKRLLTKESAELTLDEMREEQVQKMDTMRVEMKRAVTVELEKLRMQSMQDMNTFRQSMEKHVTHIDTSHAQRRLEEHEERVAKMQADLQSAVKAQRSAEEEANDLRVRLASSEERAKMLQVRQEEFRKERDDFEQERRSMRQQSQEQWQKLGIIEGELQRFKAEAEVQRNELSRLNTVRAEDSESLRRDRETFRVREMELQREISEQQRKLDEARRDAEVQALRAESEQRETVSQLRLQIERLEAEAASRAEQIHQGQQLRIQLEAERAAAQQREESLKLQAAQELRRCQEDLEEAKVREVELMHMLNEVQDSIIVAATSGSPTATGSS